MKILYGVQATGNGHISRARALAPKLKAAGFEVDYLFSGRKREDLFEMAAFGNFRCCQGLTFVTREGGIRYLATARHNNLWQLIKDIKHLELKDYSLVLTDFEPITAWSAKLAGKPSIAIGHQYAFDYRIPIDGDFWATRLLMKFFAPAQTRLGLHWHHFDQPILPPIVNLGHQAVNPNPNRILVYLPFEDSQATLALLRPFHEREFVCFSPAVKSASQQGHIFLNPTSVELFQRELANCGGVICNAGFELASEALQLGKKLLVKPLQGQMEQLSNAEALTRLKLGFSMDSLDREAVALWLDQPVPEPVSYPDVAEGIAQWLTRGCYTDFRGLVHDLWAQTPFGPPSTTPASLSQPLTGD